MKSKHPHSNLGKFLHPVGGHKVAVPGPKVPHPSPSQVMTKAPKAPKAPSTPKAPSAKIPHTPPARAAMHRAGAKR